MISPGPTRYYHAGPVSGYHVGPNFAKSIWEYESTKNQNNNNQILKILILTQEPDMNFLDFMNFLLIIGSNDVLCNFEKSIGWGPSGSARVRTMWDPHPPNNIDTNGNRTSLLRVRARVQSRLFCQFLVDRRSRISRRTCDRQQAKIPPDGSDPGRSIPPREPKKESSALNRVRWPWGNELSGGHSFILFCQCIMCDDIPRETLDGSYVKTLKNVLSSSECGIDGLSYHHRLHSWTARMMRVVLPWISNHNHAFFCRRHHLRR